MKPVFERSKKEIQPVRIITGPDTPEHTKEENAFSKQFSRTILNLRFEIIQSLGDRMDELLGPKMKKKLEDRGAIAMIKTHLLTTLGSGNLGDSNPLSHKNNVAFAHMVSSYQRKLERMTWKNNSNFVVNCRKAHLCHTVGHDAYCISHSPLKPPPNATCGCCFRIFQPGDTIVDAEDNPGVQDDAIRIVKVLFHQISRSIMSKQTDIPVNLIMNNQVPGYDSFGRQINMSRRPQIRPQPPILEDAGNSQQVDSEEGNAPEA